MRCSKCGTENKNHAKYCKRCGTSLQRNVLAQKKKKYILGAVLLLLAAAIVIAALTLYTGQKKQSEYNGKLETAQKYLEELEYEKAEANYLEAIAIEPKKQDAYLQLSDVYTVQKKYDRAIDVLKQGKREVQNQKVFDRKIKTIQDREKISETETQQYAAYYKLCLEYQKQYGAGKLTREDPLDFGEVPYLKGLCIIQPIDFNGDGNQELMLAYTNTDSMGYTSYEYEIWGWNGKTIEKIHEAEAANDIEGVRWLETAVDGGRIYLVRDRSMAEISGSADYFGYDGKTFEKACSIVLPEPESGEPGKINGDIVSDQKAISRHNRLNRPYYPKVGGNLHVDFLNENNGRLYFPLCGDGHGDPDLAAEKSCAGVLENTQKNLTELKEKSQ